MLKQLQLIACITRRSRDHINPVLASASLVHIIMHEEAKLNSELSPDMYHKNP